MRQIKILIFVISCTLVVIPILDAHGYIDISQNINIFVPLAALFAILYMAIESMLFSTTHKDLTKIIKDISKDNTTELEKKTKRARLLYGQEYGKLDQAKSYNGQLSINAKQGTTTLEFSFPDDDEMNVAEIGRRMLHADTLYETLMGLYLNLENEAREITLVDQPVSEIEHKRAMSRAIMMSNSMQEAQLVLDIVGPKRNGA